MTRRKREREPEYSSAESEAEAEQGPVPVADPEVWQDHWSEELVELWHLVRDHARARGFPILDRASFHDFATFAFVGSSGWAPRC